MKRVLLAITFMIAVTPLGQAQTFTILHSFTGGNDGGTPAAGVTLDPGGNLYGTTLGGGAPQFGTVFKLSHRSAGWVLATLYAFQSTSDGYAPHARVVFGPDGSLYGTTSVGGPQCVCGTVFNLKPPPTRPSSVIAPWIHTVIYNFTNGGQDGFFPSSEVAFDRAGNLYGTTTAGGSNSEGTLYKLTRTGNNWTETGLFSFSEADGAAPNGITFDAAGNLYGTTYSGGANGFGVVYRTTPSGSDWNYVVLHSFSHLGGENPQAGVTLDAARNLFGGTVGRDEDAVIFKLSPFGGGWAYNVLHRFTGSGQLGGLLGELAVDGDGNLYGATAMGGLYGFGLIFKLTPTVGGWIFTDMHDFAGGAEDGKLPFTSVVRDADGNLYGTTYFGGTADQGTVWRLTP